jgi:hypothetical protein
MGQGIRDLTGQKFGCQTAITYVGVNKQHRALWKCVCDCGHEQILRGHSLTTSPRDTCIACRSDKQITHEQSINYKPSRTYTSWQQMKQRAIILNTYFLNTTEVKE